jgi:DNA polymerase III epsilon subunit-like protein
MISDCVTEAEINAARFIAIFDTETTGLPKPTSAPLDKQPSIIEVGVLLCDYNGRIVDEFNSLVNPGCQISEEITKITGITNEDLVGQPSFFDLLPKLIKLFERADMAVAHNAAFDTGMFNFEMQRLELTFPWPPSIICTVEEYKPQWGGKRPRLIQLYEKIIGVPLEQTHRALDDAKALHAVLVKDKFFENII